ncbi:MAG: GNAT family N-acetyltransferase [Pseudomonadales bacterium]
MNEQNIRIQTAVLADIPELLSLETASFVTSDGLLTERAFRYHIKRGNLCLIARADNANQLAAYVLVLPHRKSARIYSLAVAKKFQQRGIARALLHQVMDEICKRKIPILKLEVRRENTGAIALYQSLGFHIQSIVQDYYGPDEDAIGMQWRSPKS